MLKTRVWKQYEINLECNSFYQFLDKRFFVGADNKMVKMDSNVMFERFGNSSMFSSFQCLSSNSHTFNELFINDFFSVFFRSLDGFFKKHKRQICSHGSLGISSRSRSQNKCKQKTKSLNNTCKEVHF